MIDGDWNNDRKYSLDGAVTCVDCEAGKITTADGSGSCSPCHAGTFQSSTGILSEPTNDDSRIMNTCISTIKWNGIGQSQCDVCPAGSISPSDGLDQCIKCSSSTVAPNSGMSICGDCATSLSPHLVPLVTQRYEPLYYLFLYVHHHHDSNRMVYVYAILDIIKVHCQIKAVFHVPREQFVPAMIFVSIQFEPHLDGGGGIPLAMMDH